MVYLQSYKELIVWQKSIELVKEIFLLTSKFPKSELYGLISQMRRASVAIPSNIAEGYGRKHKKEYHQFLSIAYSSALELETQMIISKQLNLTNSRHFSISESLLLEVLKMLNVMIAKFSI